MAAARRNEGFHVLEEFVCQALPTSSPTDHSSTTSTSEPTLKQEAIDRLHDAISMLPLDYRAIFTMHLKGKSVPDISVSLGSSQAVIATKLQTLLDQLQA